MSIYIDLHLLHTVPPSCVNRDDTGSPKTAVYGGALRARVSSQAWKHAMRASFIELFDEYELGMRTKNIAKSIENEIHLIDSTIDNEKSFKMAVDALKLIGFKMNKEKNSEIEKTDALFFISKKQAKALAEHILTLDMKDKKTKDILLADMKDNPSIDIALFGRMFASQKDLNYDAASQVAHAISTHTVSNEFDYFTATDDLQDEDNSGAGFLSIAEFNSSTLYRYATVNASELVNTLGKESVARVVRNFCEAFIHSMPTGKENSFANRTLPSTVYITIRNDQPINLCGAFESPVKKSEEGYAKASQKRLVEFSDELYGLYNAHPYKAYSINSEFKNGTVVLPLNELLDELENAVNDELNEV